MLKRLLRKRPSPAMLVALLALFVAFGPTAYALAPTITGADIVDESLSGADIRGRPGTASTPAVNGSLNGNDISGQAANAANGTPYINGSLSGWDVADNSLQGRDVRVPLSMSGSNPVGVIQATNTGDGNGFQGKTSSPVASGVYGENSGGGFGVAARSNAAGGIAIYGEANGAAGLAGKFAGAVRIDGELVCAGCVGTSDLAADAKASDADKLDNLDSTQLVVGGGRLIANRLVDPSDGEILLNVPFMGQLKVASCDATNGTIQFDTAGTGAVDYMAFGAFPSDTELFTAIAGVVTAPPRPKGMMTINIARDTGASTRIVTIWVSWDAPNGCRFQGQAVQSPQL